MEMGSSVSSNPTGTEWSMSGEASYVQNRSSPSAGPVRASVSVQHETGESAVLVVVAPVRLPAVQLNVNLIPGLQV